MKWWAFSGVATMSGGVAAMGSAIALTKRGEDDRHPHQPNKEKSDAKRAHSVDQLARHGHQMGRLVGSF